MSKFIMVKSKEDRQELKKLGLQEVNKTHDTYQKENKQLHTACFYFIRELRDNYPPLFFCWEREVN